MTTARVRPISALPSAGVLDGTEIIPAVRAGASVGMTSASLAQKAADLVSGIVVGNLDARFNTKVDKTDASSARVFSVPGAVSRSLAARAAFELSALDNMPDSLVSQVTSITDTSANNAYLGGVPSTLMPDTTSYLRDLLSRTTTKIPPGTYRITDTLEIPAGRALIGHGPSCVQILVGYKIVGGVKVPDFNPAATSAIKLNRGSQLKGLRINFAQPDVTSRSGLVSYKRAVDIDSASSSVLEDLIIGGAAEGIIGVGNSGSISLRNIQIGSFNRAFAFDGPLNYVLGSHLQAWPHGFPTEQLLKVVLDGLNVALEMGQVEALSFTDFHSSGSSVISRVSAVDAGKTLFGNIGILSLDGSGATLKFSAGQLGVGTLYSSKDGNQNFTTLEKTRTLEMSGGELTIANWSGFANGTKDGTAFATDVIQTGGILTVNGGVSRQATGGAMLFECSGGTMNLGLSIGGNPGVSFTRSAPFVKQSGTGQVDLSRVNWIYRDITDPAASQSALPDGGAAVQFNSDTYGNRLVPERLAGWTSQVLGGRSKGSYGPAVYSGTLDANGRAVVAHGFYDLAGSPAYTQMSGVVVAYPPGGQAGGYNGTAVTMGAAGNVIDSSSFRIGLGGDNTAFANFKFKLTINPIK